MKGALLVTDLDGTLLLDEAVPAAPADLAAWLLHHRARGGRWCIATGRDLPDALALLPGLGLGEPDALVVDDHDVFLPERRDWRPWEAHNARAARRRSDLFAGLEGRLQEFCEFAARHASVSVWRPPSASWGLDVRDASLLDALHRAFDISFRDVGDLVLARVGPWAVPAVRGLDKGASVRALQARWELHPRRTVVAGDGLNDLSMMTPDTAGWYVAPANAEPSVQKRASERGFVSALRGPWGVVDGLGVWPLAGLRARLSETIPAQRPVGGGRE